MKTNILRDAYRKGKRCSRIQPKKNTNSIRESLEHTGKDYFIFIVTPSNKEMKILGKLVNNNIIIKHCYLRCRRSKTSGQTDQGSLSFPSQGHSLVTSRKTILNIYRVITEQDFKFIWPGDNQLLEEDMQANKRKPTLVRL